MPRPDTKHMAIWERLLTHLPQGLVIGCVSLSVVIGGNMDVALATETQHLLQIQAQTVTGTLDHTPLKAVLEDLKEQLGLEYSGPEKEMQALISGQFQAEPLSAALSRILVAWDYALILDQTGKPVKIFLTTKFSDKTIQPSKQMQTRQVPQEHSRPSPSTESNSSRSSGLSADHDKHQQKIKAASMPIGQPDTLPRMILQPSAGQQMVITPATPSTKMPILQPGEGMVMSPSKSLTEMPIIPASVFSPMEISAVSPETVREFAEMNQ